VLLVVVAACGGGGSDAKTDDATGSTTSTTARGSTTTSSAAAASGSSATTSAPGATTTTTVARSAKPATTTGPAPIPAGTYLYKQSGSSTVGTQSYDTPPEGKLVAKPASADGKQLLQRYIDPKGEPSDVDMQFGPDGIFMIDTVLRQGGQEIRCTFDEPMPTPPWPPKVGAGAKGHAKCQGFDTDVVSSITGTKPVTVDGVSYTAFIIESTTTTTGALVSKSTQTDWFIPELRMSAHTETKSDGSYGTFKFSAHGSSDLVSAKPQ